MSDFFKSPEDLSAWVKSRKSFDDATETIMSLIQNNGSQEASGNDQQEVSETCKAIFDDKDDNAAKILFGVLAKHNITTLRKAANMNKEAQSAVQSRQRNNWVRGERNKWNRVVDGFNEGTPWRVDRNKMYDFTHYYTDNVQFDENPQHVYSGEAIWRMYVMDKFYRDYQDDKGVVVGGYINDRFHRFPDAGTPDNKDVDRFGGNPLMLGTGERTRKPRPHQYSTERRLEEARGNETYDLEATASKKDVTKTAAVIKISSKLDAKERQTDKVYNIFRDTIDMREAGIDYETMLTAVADHYDTSVLNVSEIDRFAQKAKQKHSGVIYKMEKKAQASSLLTDPSIIGRNLRMDSGNVMVKGQDGTEIALDQGTVFTRVPDGDNMFEVVDGAAAGTRFSMTDPNVKVSLSSPIQDAATELGLNDDVMDALGNAEQQTGTSLADASKQQEDFNVTEVK